jgi:hypothetical protein
MYHKVKMKEKISAIQYEIEKSGVMLLNEMRSNKEMKIDTFIKDGHDKIKHNKYATR